MAPRCMHNAALVASFTAVNMRIASSGSTSSAWGTRSTPLVPGMRMSHSINDTRCRRSCCKASSPEPAAYTSNCCCARNFLRAFRIGSSSSTTRIWTGPTPVMSATRDSLGDTVEKMAVAGLSGQPRRARTRLIARGDEPEVHWRGEQADAVRALEQLGHGAATGGSVVDRVVVDVHADEPVRARRVESAAVRARVRKGLRPMREAVLDAGLQVACNVAHQRLAQVATHNVAAERDRKSTRLNSSHPSISYAVFCLKKKSLSDFEVSVKESITSTMIPALLSVNMPSA